MDLERLRDKLDKVEALHAGATTSGERLAASEAKRRLMERLKALESTARPEPYQFSISDPYGRTLFIALARRYGLRPYRRYRQKRQTVMVDVVPSFVDDVLWPEFQVLSAELEDQLRAITARMVRDVVHPDDSEADEAPQIGDARHRDR